MLLLYEQPLRSGTYTAALAGKDRSVCMLVRVIHLCLSECLTIWWCLHSIARSWSRIARCLPLSLQHTHTHTH